MPTPERDERGRGRRGADPLRVALRSPPAEVEAALERLSAGAPLEVVLEWEGHRAPAERSSEGRFELRPTGRTRYARRLPVPRHAGVIRYIDIGRIRWIEAANQYVRLHTDDGRYLLRQSMSRLGALLSPDRFQRIHRSAIVNLDRVVELWIESASIRWALLEGGERLPVSRRYWDPLQAALLGI